MTRKRVGNLTYETSSILGRGSFGTVFSGFLEIKGSHNQSVAVKCVLNSDLEAPFIQREVDLMKKVSDHPNILRYICTEKDVDFLYIVTELCRGTLEEYIKEKYEGPRFQNRNEILRQVTEGLAHLHRLKVVHRDIKPTNILIFAPRGFLVKPQMKLADFGISRSLNPGRADYTNTSMTNPNGSKGWMAQEVYYSMRFDSKVDIFPLGCIFVYTLSRGKHPFGETPDLRLARIKHKEVIVIPEKDLKLPFSSAQEFFKLIKSMLEMDPANRPTAEDVLKSPVLAAINNNPTDVQKPIEFSMHLTDEFSEVCYSFTCHGEPISEEIVSRFKELAFDERVDVTILERESHCTSPLFFLFYHFSGDQILLIKLFKCFILKCVNVNARIGSFYPFNTYREDWTLLHHLCENEKFVEMTDKSMIDQYTELVKILLENGADVHIKDKQRNTPLQILTFRTINLTRSNNNNYLFPVEILHLLLQHGADVNERGECGSTPFHNMCHSYKDDNLIDILRLMIEHGADVNAKTDCYESPLYILCKSQRENEKLIDVIRLLIEEGADVKDGHENNPLLAICKNYKKDEFLMDIVQLLVENGADINYFSYGYGKTLLSILQERGFAL